ncbi:MAG TPA: ATP-binding cassette domain-containing protein, partial [Nitrospiria bacterium]
GEQQRVCLARAIVNHPVILLADEPTGNLDADQAARIFDLLKLINERGTTVLLTTHRHEIPPSGPRRLIRLLQGRIIGGGA